jgi:hypothetical protein
VGTPGGGRPAPIIARLVRVFVTTAVSGSGDDRPKNFVEGVKDVRSMMPMFAKKPDKVYRFELHCLDAVTGKPRWKQTVTEVKPPHPCHPSNTFATETAASDGQRVYTLFNSAGVLAAFDLDGKSYGNAKRRIQDDRRFRHRQFACRRYGVGVRAK